jgi:type II secretory pathway pseudopilin PulG
MGRPSRVGKVATQRPNVRQSGFTYLGLLFAIVLMGLMLTLAARVWTTTEQRERETQLLFIGHQFRMAISAYYANGHQYPRALSDLLADNRFPVPKRYLRRLYPDPMTGRPDWTVVFAADGVGIQGVSSSSTLRPIKRAGFQLIDATFADQDRYCAWRFLYTPERYSYKGAPAPDSTPVP